MFLEWGLKKIMIEYSFWVIGLLKWLKLHLKLKQHGNLILSVIKSLAMKSRRPGLKSIMIGFSIINHYFAIMIGLCIYICINILLHPSPPYLACIRRAKPADGSRSEMLRGGKYAGQSCMLEHNLFSMRAADTAL